MSIRLTETLSDSVDRMLSVPGGVLFALLVALKLATGVVLDTFVGAMIEFALDQTKYTFADLQDEMYERGYTIAAGELEQVYDAGLDVGVPVAILLVFLVPLLGELVRVVGVRALAAESGDGFPTDEVLDGLGGAYLRSLLAAIVAGLLVLLGSILIIPGIILAILFLFVRQSVVLGDKGVFESLSFSVGLVKRNVLQVLAIALLLLVLFFVTQFVAGLIPVGIVAVAVTSILGVFTISLVTSAYLQAVESV